MPDRHFYLLRHHILFYIKFLGFCSLAPDEISILCGENKGFLQKIMIFNQRTISPLENSSENHRLLGKPLIPIQDLNTNFQLEPKNRKVEI